MNNESKKYYLAFSLVPGVGPAKFDRLQRYFSTPEAAWQAPISELLLAGLEQKVAEEIQAARAKINLDAELENLARLKINLVTLDDSDYPELLKETSGPPFLLYYQGTLSDPRDKFAVAVVGTRKISPYGKQAAEKITAENNRQVTLAPDQTDLHWRGFSEFMPLPDWLPLWAAIYPAKSV